MASTATKLKIDHEGGTDRGVYATWEWTKTHTDHYEVWWEYQSKNKVWITASESSEKHNIATYSYPDNAIAVRVRVMPVAENRDGGDTPYWKSQYTKTVQYTVPSASGISVEGKQYDAPTGLTLNLEADTERTIHAKWKWDHSQVEYYDVEWQYQTSDQNWYYAPNDQPTVKESVYNAPNNAIAVRCHVKPIANVAYETDTRIVYYWLSSYTSWVKFVIPVKKEDEEPDIPRSGAPYKLTIGVQNGTDDTLYATWAFANHSTTDHYEVKWRYYTGDLDKDKKKVWYDGGTSNTTVKNATYDPPDNAKEVYYTVLPVAKEVNSIPRFIGKQSAVMKYTALTPKDPKTSITKMRIQREAGNNTSLVVSWSWSKHSETDHYELKWRYQNGNKDADGKYIWFPLSDTTSTSQNAIQSQIPSNALKVQFRIKPVAKNGQWVKGWTDWAPKAGYSYPVPKPAAATVSKLSRTVTSVAMAIQNGTDRTVYARWEWTQDNTDGYSVQWQYATRGEIWFEGSKTDLENSRTSLYSAPENAIAVRVKIRPIAKKHKVQGNDTSYWTADTSKWYGFNLKEQNHTPAQASTPAVTIDGNTLKAQLTTYDDNTLIVEFQVVKNNSKVVNTVRAVANTRRAAVSVKVDIGGEYKVRARGLYPINNKTIKTIIKNVKSTANAYVGEWSEYSENIGTAPATPTKINKHIVESTESVRLQWTAVSNVTGYRIEYTTNKNYFDKSDQVKSVDISGGEAQWYLTGLEAGNRYYVRVRAVNDNGVSGWTPIYSFILGTKPSSPTTWSDSNKCIIGDKMYLYWLHNSEDASSQTAARVALTVNNGESIGYDPTYMSDGTTPSYYILDSKAVSEAAMKDSKNDDVLDSKGNVIKFRSVRNYPENTVIKWSVRTKGISEWSDWSKGRIITIYAQPVLELYVGNSLAKTTREYEIKKYPLRIYGEAYPLSQKAISYNVSIIANESYVTHEYDGEEVSVRDQEVVFSRYVPARNSARSNILDIKLYPSDVNLENNITYTVKVVAGMDSGLIAESSWTFTARWDVDTLVPDAEVTIDQDKLIAYIRPFCDDEYGDPMDDVTLSVFRHDYDGRFIELATDLNNGEMTIVDPHPNLNYARYRVVAMDNSTGEIGWRDIPPQYVGETSIVIQWDENWETFSTNNGEYEDPLADIGRGSFVRLPYNIEVSESNSLDVALNEYIGRSHPVSYYGTQLGVKGDWNAVIPRDDIETIYALRRLAIYRGDVYVREPSGVGYWANVTVSFSKRYNEMTIPITVNVVRVEGEENNA